MSTTNPPSTPLNASPHPSTPLLLSTAEKTAAINKLLREKSIPEKDHGNLKRAAKQLGYEWIYRLTQIQTKSDSDPETLWFDVLTKHMNVTQKLMIENGKLVGEIAAARKFLEECLEGLKGAREVEGEGESGGEGVLSPSSRWLTETRAVREVAGTSPRGVQTLSEKDIESRPTGKGMGEGCDDGESGEGLQRDEGKADEERGSVHEG